MRYQGTHRKLIKSGRVDNAASQPTADVENGLCLPRYPAVNTYSRQACRTDGARSLSGLGGTVVGGAVNPNGVTVQSGVFIDE
jgi:hypothetical protein